MTGIVGRAHGVCADIIDIVSATHVLGEEVIGVGSRRRVSAVRWGVTVRIISARVLTDPVSAALA